LIVFLVLLLVVSLSRLASPLSPLIPLLMAELYEKMTGRKPDRLIIVTPYIDEKALEAARQLGVEAYTKV